MIGPLHVISDPQAGCDVLEQARVAAWGGAWAVQLRDKEASDALMVQMAREILDCLAPFGVRLIVNDRVEVACQVGAHGVHIGQMDGDPIQVRQRIGPDMLLGLSIENTEQAYAMPRGIVDYVGAGPIRGTSSKPDHAAPIGFDGLARIARLVSVPVIAIGGLAAPDIPGLIAAGAKGMAVMSAASRASSPEAAIRKMAAGWDGL